MITFHKLPAVEREAGKKRSSLYQDIGDGMFPTPIKVGPRASVWADYEVDAVNRARLAALSDTQIRALVSRLLSARPLLAQQTYVEIHQFVAGLIAGSPDARRGGAGGSRQ